ncbi:MULTISPECIES: GNAT family N-acetyltransferase [Sinorhizobium]|uniref:GCN5-related N-acetyltransferase protein n=1 Tax=Rhizobium fredii TaxID=380 RepID=A0A2L0GZY9_RHIFR|nr:MULTISPECIES: GNAT family N-acetyltransferase [Sinorhizobium]AUX74767.1 GCN5-related N-acetyltransferase protein [Sinorhizobium fredii]PDT53634.1 GNAT family N-acetyltransferase [Sinorhizobium sp. NG07B]POH30699.1 acetyltransferase [Sinorhizobium americanum]
METLRLDPGFDRYEELLALILKSFASMDGRIDPPSSAHALTVESLRQKSRDEVGFVVANGADLLGCVFLKPEPDCLYIGKLAIDPGHQGKGLGRQLLTAAEETARSLGLPALRLQTRIELTENHATFAAWGFVETGRSAHPGFTRPTSIEMRKMLR